MGPKILDLFAGAGGMTLGFHAAGCRSVGAMDRDEAAARTYRRMFAGHDPVVFGGLEGEAATLPPEKLLESLRETPDLVIGGPPCQGFSRIGRAKQASLLAESDRARLAGVRDPHRNELYQYFLEVVSLAKPLAFVMENVPGLKDLKGVDYAQRIARVASMLGYNVRYFLLNAVHYGVPQYRWRFFFVGYRGDLGPEAVPAPPTITHRASVTPPEGFSMGDDDRMLWGSQIPVAQNVRPAVTVYEAIGDLPRFKEHLNGVSLTGDRRMRPGKPRSDFARMMREWPGLPVVEEVNGNWFRQNTRDFEIFRRMSEGDRYPQVVRIGHERLMRRLAESAADGEVIEPGTERYAEVVKEVTPTYRNDAFDDKWRKLSMDQPSWTLTAHLGKDAYSHIHYDSRQARTLTIREAARLQSFPDAFEFEGNFGQQLAQIGNAVPPLLAKALAEVVAERLTST